MDEVSAIKILNNIINSTTFEVSIIESKIENKNEEIKQEIIQLKKITDGIVSIEEEMKNKNKEIEDFEEKEASIQSEMEDLENDISVMDIEIQDCANRIKEEDSDRGSVGDILNHIFNPIGSMVSDLIKELTSNIKDLMKKIEFNQSEIKRKKEEMGKLKSNQEEFDKSIIDLEMKINDLMGTEKQFENNIKQLGIEKTNSENVLLQLKQVKSRCKQIIEDSEQDKDLLNIGINLVDEIITKTKELYINNNFKIDF
ncbi:hypothetical protein ACTA71_000363 [Dictyostelium dimigraforme]